MWKEKRFDLLVFENENNWISDGDFLFREQSILNQSTAISQNLQDLAGHLSSNSINSHIGPKLFGQFVQVFIEVFVT